MRKHEGTKFQTEGALRAKALRQALPWQVKTSRRLRACRVIAKRRGPEDSPEGGQVTDDAELFRPQEKFYSKKQQTRCGGGEGN